jgi:predicted nuclease of predicted toxin-antitoxin system
MAKFVIDEDMPRSTATALINEGYEVKDVRDHGYRGVPDEGVYSFAQEEKAVLLTADLGFSNIRKFPLGRHFGIVVARYPNEMPPRDINRAIVTSLKDLGESDFKGNLIILEPGRIRIRRTA